MRKWLLLLALAVFGCNRSSAARGPELRQQSRESRTAPTLEVVKVVSEKLSTTDYLPAELTPYQAVSIYPRVNGFVEEIPVDRGSVVHRGQLLVRLSAPELISQRAEAQAKMSADYATYRRLKEAAKTTGAVAPNEVEVALNTFNADQERVRSLRTLENYLTVTAPFDGIITQRDVHPGALVGPPSSAAAIPLVRIEQDNVLRLTVPVPEADAGNVIRGAAADFTVSTWPGENFVGTIARISHSIDQRTRTMPVELDVDNRNGRLAPGMFAEVRWPVHRNIATLFVPASAVVETMEMTFVQVVREGSVRRIAVKRGKTEKNLVEVFGALNPGDLAAARGWEELADGTRVTGRLAETARGRWSRP
jgi:membrane fusion protein, multidrug efflux system